MIAPTASDGMPTWLSARLSTNCTFLSSYSISWRVSKPSFVFLSDNESSIATMHSAVELSTAAITSGVKLGGVSTITKSLVSRRTR